MPKTKPIVIGACYRPQTDTRFFEVFEDTLSKIRSDLELIILGDFNVDYALKQDHLLSKMKQVLQLFDCKQLINSPTRVCRTRASILDHVICNNVNKISQSGTIGVGISDHQFLIYCTRKITKVKCTNHNIVKMRSLKNYSKDDLLSALVATDWTHVYCSDIDIAWNVFSNNFISVLDKVAPLKEVRIKNKTEPWMNNDILENIRKRDMLLHQFKKDNNSGVYEQFCRTRNQIQRDIKKAKASYFSDKIEENKNNPKGLWKQFRSLGYSSNGKDQSQIVLTVNGEKCFNSTVVADCFNEFYTNVAGNLVKNLPPSKGLLNTDSDVFKNYYKEKGVESKCFTLSPVTSEFVYKELCKLNPSKSTGLDGIPARFLRDGAIVIKDHLAHIFNLSISSSSVPKDFKTARVKPLFKKNERSEVGNYRPVSIISVASKILERAVYVQLESYLRENDILYGFQSGFRGSFSTDTCLTHLTDHIHNQTSCCNFTGMVLIDLQKAFDTVDHVILLKKLEAMGVSSVDWFRSYLSGRTQIVNVNQVDSAPLDITCGVPQGSILGPLLFYVTLMTCPSVSTANCFYMLMTVPCWFRIKILKLSPTD